MREMNLKLHRTIAFNIKYAVRIRFKSESTIVVLRRDGIVVVRGRARSKSPATLEESKTKRSREDHARGSPLRTRFHSGRDRVTRRK